jgi:hypothetical protein
MDTIYVFSVQYKSFAPTFLMELWGWYGSSDTQYASSGQGLKDSNGWVLTQSKFNALELIGQLLYLFVLPQDSAHALLTIMCCSIATLWKTLLYMSIIYHSNDPVKMVPGLACLGYTPLPQHANEVTASLKTDSCAMQAFKFHFNFYWIVVPLMVIYASWMKIVHVMDAPAKNKKS